MEVLVIFIEFSPDRDQPQWFTCDPNALPITFAELNGSKNFRKDHPKVMIGIEGDVNEWQRMRLMAGVHFLVAYGREK